MINNEITEIYFNKLNQAINKFICDTTEIFIANGEDLLLLDLNEIPKNVFLLSDMSIKKGTVYKIMDNELKLKLFDFCTKHKDRCFQGLGE